MNSIKKLNIDDLMLLHGKPILIPSTPINVFPIRLKDISEIGVRKYYRYLNLICLNASEIEGLLKDTEISDAEGIYAFLIVTSLAQLDFRQEVQKAFKFFTHERIYLNKEDNYFYVKRSDGEDFKVDFETFEMLQKIVKKQNYMDSKKEEEVAKPINDRARAILEKQRKGRETVARLKEKNSEDSIDFHDLVGSLAAKGNGLNILNIWNLTYYAFNDQLQRLKMIEEYSNGIQSLIAGADSKKVKLKYWIRSIQSTK